MGYRSHSIENMGAPFILADEMVFHIPKSGELIITQDQFKLLFVLKGHAMHEIDGLNGPTDLRAGDILVSTHFRRHRYLNPDSRDGRQLHVMRLFLDGEAIRKSQQKRNRQPELYLTDFVAHHFTRNHQISDGIDGEITSHLNQLRSETERRDIGLRHRARALCSDLLITVARKLTQVQRTVDCPQKSNGSHLVASAKEYILKNLDSHLTLGEIAWKTGKGEEHLARVFKKETGQSVFDFVREMRVNQAKTYLLNSALSLTAIADQCGFSSLSFFSRTFKAIVGIPPSHYRQYAEATLQPMNRDPAR